MPDIPRPPTPHPGSCFVQLGQKTDMNSLAALSSTRANKTFFMYVARAKSNHNDQILIYVLFLFSFNDYCGDVSFFMISLPHWLPNKKIGSNVVDTIRRLFIC